MSLSIVFFNRSFYLADIDWLEVLVLVYLKKQVFTLQHWLYMSFH